MTIVAVVRHQKVAMCLTVSGHNVLTERKNYLRSQTGLSPIRSEIALNDKKKVNPWNKRANQIKQKDRAFWKQSSETTKTAKQQVKQKGRSESSQYCTTKRWHRAQKSESKTTAFRTWKQHSFLRRTRNDVSKKVKEVALISWI